MREKGGRERGESGTLHASTVPGVANGWLTSAGGGLQVHPVSLPLQVRREPASQPAETSLAHGAGDKEGRGGGGMGRGGGVW